MSGSGAIRVAVLAASGKIASRSSREDRQLALLPSSIQFGHRAGHDTSPEAARSIARTRGKVATILNEKLALISEAAESVARQVSMGRAMSDDDLQMKLLQIIRLLRPNTILTRLDRNTGMPVKMSFGDFGQPWIEEIVKKLLPDKKVFTPLAASSLYGEFFHEFDCWRSALNLFNLTSYQGLLVEGTDFYTACLRLSKKDKMTDWYGKPYKGNLVCFFCIDRMLVQEISLSLYHLIASGLEPTQALIDWLDKEQDASNTLSSNLPPRLSGEIAGARGMFRRCARELRDVFGPSAATEVLDRLIADRTERVAISEEKWMFSYCESVAFHFLMGHEFGHYAIKDQSCNWVKDILSLVHQALPQTAAEGLREEVFCDMVGLENCLFQMHKFEVPPAFTVVGTAWAIAFVLSVAENVGGSSEQNLRLQSWLDYWRLRPIPTGSNDIVRIANDVITALNPLTKTVACLVTQQGR